MSAKDFLLLIIGEVKKRVAAYRVAQKSSNHQ